MYDEYADLRDSFEIIAFHDGTAKDFAKLDAEVAARRLTAKWNGKDLPFPVFLDSTETTVRKMFQIEAFPTTMLIDPEGKGVEGYAEKVLEEKLKGLRERRLAEVNAGENENALRDGVASGIAKARAAEEEAAAADKAAVIRRMAERLAAKQAAEAEAAKKAIQDKIEKAIAETSGLRGGDDREAADPPSPPKNCRGPKSGYAGDGQ